MFSASKFEHSYTKSPFIYTEPISQDFKVFVGRKFRSIPAGFQSIRSTPIGLATKEILSNPRLPPL